MANPSRKKNVPKIQFIRQKQKGGILKILPLLTQPNTFVALNIFLLLKLIFKVFFLSFSRQKKSSQIRLNYSVIICLLLQFGSKKKLHKKRWRLQSNCNETASISFKKWDVFFFRTLERDSYFQTVMNKTHNNLSCHCVRLFQQFIVQIFGLLDWDVWPAA